MEKLEHFFYVSRAADGIGQREIDDILVTSSRRNAALNLGGMLMYTGNHFAQILEGDSDDLEPVIASIMADARHHGICVLRHAPQPNRQFVEWTLRYAESLGAVDLIENLVAKPDIAPERAQRLVQILFAD